MSGVVFMPINHQKKNKIKLAFLTILERFYDFALKLLSNNWIFRPKTWKKRRSPDLNKRFGGVIKFFPDFFLAFQTIIHNIKTLTDPLQAL